MPDRFTITSPRARLRRFRAEDLDLLVQLESDPEVMRFTSARVALSREESARRLERMIEKEKEREPLGIWAAELKSGEFLGWFMLMPVEPRVPELGFMILKKYWGQGFTTEIGHALLEYAGRLGYEDCAAETDPANHVSIRVLEKLGFHFTGKVSAVDKATQQPIELNHYEVAIG